MTLSNSGQTENDWTRLQEAILYIAERSKDDPRFGAVKLNKILYYADFEAFRRFGTPITGATYQHLAQGPAPKELLIAKRALESRKELVEESRSYLNREQKRIVPQRHANVELFHPEELMILDQVIGDLWLANGSQVGALSHEEWGWKFTELGETIPYESAWLSPEPLSQEQIERGQELWQERQRRIG
jgi:hypothetical protein